MPTTRKGYLLVPAFLALAALVLTAGPAPSHALFENPYGIAGHIQDSDLRTHKFGLGVQTYSWNSLADGKQYQMVRPYHAGAPNANICKEWIASDARNRPKDWFYKETYPGGGVPWETRKRLREQVLE